MSYRRLNPKHWLPFKKTWRNYCLILQFKILFLRSLSFSVWWGFVRNYESVWTHFGSECCRWSHTVHTQTPQPCVNIQRESYSLYTPLQHSRSLLLLLCLFLPSGVECDNVVVQLLWERFGAGEQYLPFYGFVSCVARLQVLFGKSMTRYFLRSILQHYPHFATLSSFCNTILILQHYPHFATAKLAIFCECARLLNY